MARSSAAGARDKPYDVIVFGAGPAGLAAAIQARRLELEVLVLGDTTTPRRSCCGWISPAGVALCGELGLEAKTARATPFDKLRIHSWDFRKSVVVADPEMNGWLIERETFDAGLAGIAKKLKATMRGGAPISELALRDDRIEATLGDGSSVVGRFAVIADGATSETAGRANLIPAHRAGASAQAMFADFAGVKPNGELDVAIGASRYGQLAVLTRDKARSRLMVATRPCDTPVETLFRQIVEAARTAGVLPGEPLAAPSRAMVPAGAALDLEAHVGKRCLLIGDAGGFVTSFSHEGIYPAMRSGILAAEAIAAASKVRLPQDELSRFSDSWRTQLADYLRMPNTDLSLLMPLIFSNAQMSKRVARAFLLGQAF